MSVEAEGPVPERDGTAPPLVVGVDGGGTRTRAVVLDLEGRERSRAEGGAAVARADDPEAAAHEVARTVRDALGVLGVERAAALHAGLAGAGRAAARDAVVAVLRELDLATLVSVGTDVEAAYHDAHGDGPGLLLIAGTGSVAWGRGPDGATVRVGGWGPWVGDEGSAADVGRRAVVRVLRHLDARDGPTALTEVVAEAAGAATPETVLSWMTRASRAEVAALAPRVVAAADAGDAAAEVIATEAALELVELVEAGRARLGPWPEPPPLALGGGFIGPDGALRSRVLDALGGLDVRIVPDAVDAGLGAARLALAAAASR